MGKLKWYELIGFVIVFLFAVFFFVGVYVKFFNGDIDWTTFRDGAGVFAMNLGMLFRKNIGTIAKTALGITTEEQKKDVDIDDTMEELDEKQREILKSQAELHEAVKKVQDITDKIPTWEEIESYAPDDGGDNE